MFEFENNNFFIIAAVQSFEKSQDKERIASLIKELDDLKVQLSETKSKGDQARARVNVLSADISILRTKYETLVSKNDEDNKLINTLTVSTFLIFIICIIFFNCFAAII